MNSKSTRPIHSGRVAVVIELEIPRDGAGNWLRLVTSIPGREGTLTHVWEPQAGRLAQSDWEDMQARVCGHLATAIEFTGGIQLGLPI